MGKFQGPYSSRSRCVGLLSVALCLSLGWVSLGKAMSPRPCHGVALHNHPHAQEDPSLDVMLDILQLAL